MKTIELEERLIDFAVRMILLADEISGSKAGQHLGMQLLRSGTSAPLNYGEAQSGESKKDFVHKIQIVLKELRETNINLKIIQKAKLCQSEEKIESALSECNELIAIFVKSVKTAQSNQNR